VLAIAALFLWVLTAAAGVSLLSSGRAARDTVTSRSPAAGPAAGPDHKPAGPAQTDGPPAGPAQTDGSPAGPAQTDGPAARYAALPLTEDGRPPPGPHVKVAAPPGEHPLLQFSHPALALTGLAFWLAFVLVRYRPLAWISFGILVVTVGAGLGWLAGNALAARRRPRAARTFPPRLIVLHGLAAVGTLALTVLTALSAGHG
jgi:hypothetical protein